MGTPTFYASSTSKYLIPIKINQIKVSKYSFMQQDVSIIPFNKEKNLVALIITDQTNMANTNALLEENINKVKELNRELIKERDTIDKKVLLIKFNNNAKITDVSKAYLQLIEYEKDELTNDNYFVFERVHILKDLRDEILKHMKTQTVFKFEHKTLSKSNKELWLNTTLVPEYDKFANHVGFILFNEDITNSKELHDYQEQMLLNSRFIAMGEMISMIAHQWRQPLSTVSSTIINLKIKKELNNLDSDTIDKAYDNIENNIYYLSSTIDDFTNFIKSDKNIKEIQLSKLFDNSMVLFKNLVGSGEITYSQNIDTNIKISTYQNELIQVTLNIIKNSIDAFKENNIDNQQITIKVTKDDDYAFIYIKDNAGGIEQKSILKIFEPYFSTKSKNRTGLGLYISKRIVEENLKGTVNVKSYNNETEFCIKLPLTID